MIDNVEKSTQQRQENSPVVPKNNHRQPVSTNRLNAFQILTITVALMVTAGIAFLAGVIYDRQQGVAYSDEFEIFWEAWNYIEDQYYEEPPAVEDRVYGGISGIIQVLNDPYSSVSPPVIAEEHREQIEGKFGGIGASVSINESGEAFIVEVLNDICIPQTPADKAGLQSNDIIKAVDQQNVTGLSIDEVVDRVKGKEGTDVTLTIYRPASDETFDVRIRREIIEQITVVDNMIDDVGYLYLSIFNGVATKQMQCKLENMLAENPRAIIFDLRANGGGWLNEAITVADLFLDEGLVLSQRNRKGVTEELYSHDGGIAENIPLVVLIDHGSASASEVVAGALQDHQRAVLIGQTSFGKGSVQNVHALSDGGELRITAASWYTPDGRRIHGIGLEPDIIIEGEQIDADGYDRVVQTALDYIYETFATEGDTSPSPTSRPVGVLPIITSKV